MTVFQIVRQLPAKMGSGSLAISGFQKDRVEMMVARNRALTRPRIEISCHIMQVEMMVARYRALTHRYTLLFETITSSRNDGSPIQGIDTVIRCSSFNGLNFVEMMVARYRALTQIIDNII